jgi:hypothetical protein
MSNIEKTRSELKISGYVHPIAKPSGIYNPYKTFNTESKKSDYETAKNKSGYATFTDKQSTTKQADGCPDCGGEALYVCNCELKDKQCEKGHVWHVTKLGHIKRGDPHDDE